MNILGISAYYHDSACALIQDGEVLAAAQEERFTRKKHDPSFPLNAARFCLSYAGLSIDDLDAVVFYDKPFLKFERLLETYYSFAPKGLRSFLTAIPVWLKEKMFLKKMLRDGLREIGPYDAKKLKLLFPEHHLSHAASTFFVSPFEKAAILTIDGVGEWATASISLGENNSITAIKELRFPHSLGLLYSAFTYYCGFKVNSGEYKLMGLAPYGSPNSAAVRKYIDLIRSKLIKIYDDGSVWLNQEYFDYPTGLRMTNDSRWLELFGVPKRQPESELSQEYCDLALAIQNVTEEVVVLMAREAKRLTGANKLCMAGGVALNCVANGKLQDEGIFDEIYIQPAAGDAGGAVGSALAAYHIYFNNQRTPSGCYDSMHGAYLGPEFSDLEIRQVSRKYRAVFEHFDSFSVLAEKTAEVLADGKVVGWFQGRMEFGPRALGNRSILGDARNPEMQRQLNLKIKYRESFRPFAPSVLDEVKEDYFSLKTSSPYMLLVHQVKDKRRKTVPDNYADLPLKKKLYHLRSDLPAITHIDFSARIQTVHKETNERYWQLIEVFQRKTGYGVIVNTSFNVRGEPIVCTPEDAYRCFMRTEMDFLVIGNYLFDKTQQQEWKETDEWQAEYQLD
ncbi:MAG TPA: carbamoyltransferase [Pyrinomonadaceae bacterium]|nr:carbamoyltransferase [Pyrinomonadaceae bacterium]HMP66315.1 carbamoyltransferase [Pyrinomonadaceae bacterium]